ncbi:MAG: IS21 family transposase [Deltaproteobacteria bacterium]|nr:IS21 family transposase [Deltaproteobacteria bacterium]
MNEIVEMIYQWHQGIGLREIRRSLGFDRNTVRKYVRLAQTVGISRDVPFPLESDLVEKLKAATDAAVLRATPAQDMIVTHKEWITELLRNEKIKAKQIWRLFQEKTGVKIGYCTMLRYLKFQFQWGAPSVTVRIEVAPGSQAQVDFGYGGMMKDPETGRRRKAWSFIMTLSYSRHRFVRFVFRRDVRNWIDCHVRAFAFLGGVPGTIVLDNLKPGVLKPDIYDPTLNRAYADLERHYGFVADPAKVGKPKHKGKVERMVPVVRQHLLMGRDFRDIDEANERALSWCRQEIGMEVHGTTQKRPFEVFQREEASCLKPLPAESFECPQWKKCVVHPDHHVVFDRSYYSLPTRFIGKEVWVRGGCRVVHIFLDEQMIKTHSRALLPGTFMTDYSDYPPQKQAYLMPAPTLCRAKAAEIGPQTETLIRMILSDHAMRNLRKAQAVLRLAEKYGNTAMEAAAERAVFFGNFRYQSIKDILEKGLKMVPESTLRIPVTLSPLGQRFLRPLDYFAAGMEVTS